MGGDTITYTNPLIKQFCDTYMEGNEFNGENIEKYYKISRQRLITNLSNVPLSITFNKFIEDKIQQCSESQLTDFLNRFQYVIIEKAEVYDATPLKTAKLNTHFSRGRSKCDVIMQTSDLIEVGKMTTFHIYNFCLWFSGVIGELVCQLPQELKEGKYYYSYKGITEVLETHAVTIHFYLRK